MSERGFAVDRVIVDEEIVPDDWEGCLYPYPDHDWTPGELECGRCGADLSDWNETRGEDDYMELDDNWRGWRDDP